jgi:hypothetical protein
MRTEPPGFADFWAIWLPIKRRNDGRGEARATYAKHIKAGVDPQDIIDGARWYARNTPAGYEYVPLASTWLNRGVYEDDGPRERAFQEHKQAPQNVVPIKPPRSAFLIEFERKQNA